MNCFPYTSSGYATKDGEKLQNGRTPNTRLTQQPGIDLNPYLNFLLDLNTLDLKAQPLQPLAETSIHSKKSPLSQEPIVNRAFNQKLGSLKPETSLSTKEITNRLDRLEVQLSKIVNNVVKEPPTKRSSSKSLRRCLTPVTSEDEDDCRVRRLPNKKKEEEGEEEEEEEEEKEGSQYFRKQNRKQKNPCEEKRSYKLIPPASFEDEEPQMLPVRVKSRCSEEKSARLLEVQTKLENEVKDEQTRREKVEVELSASKEEMKKLKSLTEVKAAESAECLEKLANVKAKLAEEVQRREKAEKNLEVHKKLACGLGAKLKASEQREHDLQSCVTQKDSALASLNSLQTENQFLKDEIRRLSIQTATKKPACKREGDKDATRKSVDEAMRKATTKFTKFHKDEVRRFELQLRTSQEVIRDLEAQIEAVAAKDAAELSKLRASCSRMELDVSASKSREELQERRVCELIEQIEEITQQKDEEIAKLQKTVACLRKECERVKNTMATWHSEKTSLRGLSDAVEDGERRVSRLQQEKTALQEEVSRLEEERRICQAKLGKAEDTERSLREAQQQQARTRDEALEKLKLEIESGKIKDKVAEDLQDTIQKLRRTIDISQKQAASTADAEHFKRRNRELEEVLERLENRKEELKDQLSATEAQLQESNQAHLIINAKWKEKSAYITRLQTNQAALQVRFEVKEEELKQERDAALERVQTLENTVEELTVRSRQLRQSEVLRLKAKYEQQLARKECNTAKVEEQNRELEQRLREISQELCSQKKQITGKFTRLGRFLQDFENDLC
ncbi:hypothetical protein BV898_11740 [Hypsibius exemplaris]|uniref:Uncharacterized protein n=1 Tax=Hypsibius exemplaris TaxID=2072580 RepID=A0A1W0WFU2_HYPEX|nr:hypothetical protein BV898_11740 [Hypsibius exemplaris]